MHVLAAAGYNGERLVMMVGSDIPDILAMSQVGEAAFRKAGINVEFQSSDWGTVTQRRLNRKPVAEGGWNCYFVPLPGSYLADPILSPQFRGTSEIPGNGFTTSARLDEILAQWLVAPDSEKMKLAEALQRQTRIDVPFVPVGNYVVPTVFRNVIHDMPSGSVIKFWGLTKDA
jgi:peptide/nickel transport system substrate-binding protein